ncbi:hypothetical protein HPB52_007616 [Rhipicephalus sanguineus]|uniref:Uncharacterized protein n=1 Tax=Rhipicephalus sanguineus TaxID=34632 RepID=A0A9D4Q5H1_RHISA|nr:hypothetical protein HPB52_007616 [Rhipicephalus sanguineus]
MALELQRFHAFLFMETAYVTSLDFVYAVPAAVVGPGPTQLAAILPLRLWLCATVAALGVAVVTTILRIAPHEKPARRMAQLISESLSLALGLVALCFGQPLGWRDDILLNSHQDTLDLPPVGLDSLKYGRRQRLLATCRTRKFNERITHSRRCATRLLLSVWLLSVVALLTAVQSCLISRLRTPPAPSALDSTERLREALVQGLVLPCLVGKTGSAEYIIQSHIEEQDGVNVPRAQSDSLVTFFGAPVAAVGWPHADHMHWLSSRIFETGLVQWHERLIDARNVSASRRMRRMRHLSHEDSSVLEDLRVGPLNLLRFAIAFSALLCGCTAAAVVAWCERIHRWTHQWQRRCACASEIRGQAHCLLAHPDDSLV